MSDVLNDVLRFAREFKPIPRPRIIVGMPVLQCDVIWKREADGLLLIGRSAWEALVRSVPAVPFPTPHVDTFMGIEVEFFGDRADHQALMREIFEAMARGLLLRVAIDQEFGDTRPLIDEAQIRPRRDR